MGYGAQKGRLLVGVLCGLRLLKGDIMMGEILVVRSVYVGGSFWGVMLIEVTCRAWEL
jgi:hypothetical protein